MAFVEGAIFVVGATSVLIWNATAPIEVPRIDKPKLTVIEGGKNSNNQSKPMAPPLPIPQSNEKNKHEKVILYHYTSKQGLEGILADKNILAAKKSIRPKDARDGDGVYLTDVAPNTISNVQLT